MLEFGSSRAGDLARSAGAPGRTVLMDPNEVLYERLRRSHELFDIVGEEAFEERARQLLAGPGARPVQPAFEHYWRTLVAHVYRDVLGVDEVAGNEVVREHALRLLAAAAVVAFPAAAESARPRLPATIRRALEYVAKHARDDIGVAEIAAAARLTVRGVQQSFRRHLGTSPTAYLRAVRLANARDDLIAAQPGSGTTVEGVARRNRFSHLSRFAAAYRDAYGESPATTLRA